MSLGVEFVIFSCVILSFFSIVWLKVFLFMIVVGEIYYVVE